MRASGSRGRSLDESNIEAWHPEAAAFYRLRGLTHSTVHRFGLGRVVRGRYAGRLAIPYQDGQYRVRAVRYRAIRPDATPKVLNEAGKGLHLFAIRATDEAVGVICEGEIDAMTAWQCGVKAVGVPGANVWKAEWAYLFRNCDEVIIAFDNDEAGDKGAHTIWRSLNRIGVDVRKALLPPMRDLNDVLVSEGAQAVREVLGVQ